MQQRYSNQAKGIKFFGFQIRADVSDADGEQHVGNKPGAKSQLWAFQGPEGVSTVYRPQSSSPAETPRRSQQHT